MDQARVDYLSNKGFMKAAQRVGSSTTQYRPSQLTAPMAQVYATFMAAFSRDAAFSFTQPLTWGRPNGIGLFDTTDVQTGDIVVNNGDTFFVSRKEAFRPAIVILCNRVVSLFGSLGTAPQNDALSGSTACPLAGVQSDYGTSFSGGANAAASGWPCSILLSGRGDRSASGVPGASRASTFQLLLPELPGGVFPQPYSNIRDDLGNTYRIDSVEVTQYGIRCGIHLVQV